MPATVRKKLAKRDTLRAIRSLTYAVFSSEMGWCCLVWNGELVESVICGQRSREAAREAGFALSEGSVAFHSADMGEPAVASLVDRIRLYAAGAADNFRDVKLNLQNLTKLQRRVIELCRQIPTGSVCSYGELAAKAGAHGAARAVGTIMAKCRFSVIVPCHRVIGSGRKIGGYSGPDGISVKRQLLAREGVIVGTS